MKIGLILKGMAMGIAEAIPGVSGGTIAFITGIYEELLSTIKSFTPTNLFLAVKDIKRFWIVINGQFLLWLLSGMVIGLLFGILVISHLLESHQILLWAFFFGLVLASAIYLARGITWDIQSVMSAIIGAVVAYFISQLTPSSGSDNPIYLFLSGCIAISALMLPGLSGSFMLLLLGLYDQIINGIKGIISDHDFSQLLPIGIFAAGALTGLFSFARVLSFLFKKYPHTTMATMIGVLIGSLTKLWPWKRINTVYDKITSKSLEMAGVVLPDAERYKILSETNLMPGAYSEYGDPRTLAVAACFIGGLMIVGLISRMSKDTVSTDHN